MKTIKINDTSKIPKNFTGIVHLSRDNELGYLLNGNLHRLDGPALIVSNGDEHYWINGKFISENEQKFYGSKEYKQAILLENLKLIKNI